MGVGNQTLYAHALKRALILFLLGMIAQGNLLAFDLSKLHPCYSVLHGIAAGYLIATFVMVNLRPLWQAIVSASFLLGYWALLMLLSIPGFGRGVLTPEGNAAAYIDRLVLGRFHYGMNTWFLSYLGFASSVLLGVLAGELLLSRRSTRKKIAGLFLTGTALLILGLVWSLWFPIIKLLWTSSYVLVTGGISFLLMGLFYMIVDVLKWGKWAFGFAVIGMNSLAVYMATMLFNFRHIGNIFVGSLLPRVGNWNNFLEASAGFSVVWLILYWMYRTKSFVRL
jgi:predicted acyltransferase